MTKVMLMKPCLSYYRWRRYLRRYTSASEEMTETMNNHSKMCPATPGVTVSVTIRLNIVPLKRSSQSLRPTRSLASAASARPSLMSCNCSFERPKLSKLFSTA